MSHVPPIQPQNPFPQFPPEPPRSGSGWKVVVIILGLLTLIPLCCCLGVLGVSVWNSGNEITISNARRTFITVEVDYRFHHEPARNTRYTLVIEDARGSRSEYFMIGEMSRQGTFTARGARMPAGPGKIYFEANGPGRHNQRTSNVLSLN